MKRSYRSPEEDEHGERGRVREEDPESISMASVLMLLSGRGRSAGDGAEESADLVAEEEGRMFECKTCSRRFPTFHALGGHRAKHKKSKLTDDGRGGGGAKSRVHECSICGLEFAIGQALGGHMRRHRAALPPPAKSAADGDRRPGMLLDLNLPPLAGDRGSQSWYWN